MFSLCRLCGNYIEPTELTTEISELESKLTVCCGWKQSEYELQMPKKVCQLCINELDRSWCFAAKIWAAENELNILLKEQNQVEIDESSSCCFETKYVVEMNHNNRKIDVDTQTSEIEDNIDDNQVYFDNESEKSSNSNCDKEEEDKLQMKNDPLLAQLNPGDFLRNGLISTIGVAKLEQQFPEMKIISWNDCQYKCNKCNQIIKGSHNLFSHNRSFHSNELHSIKLSCFYCNAQHRREFTLNRHITTKHFGHLKFRYDSLSVDLLISFYSYFHF